MINSNDDQWVTPEVASQEMSRRAGYFVSQDDIRQLKRTGKIVHTRKLTDRITLYSLNEIRTVPPPKKRHPKPYQDVEDTAKQTDGKPDDLKSVA